MRVQRYRERRRNDSASNSNSRKTVLFPQVSCESAGQNTGSGASNLSENLLLETVGRGK